MDQRHAVRCIQRILKIMQILSRRIIFFSTRSRVSLRIVNAYVRFIRDEDARSASSSRYIRRDVEDDVARDIV